MNATLSQVDIRRYILISSGEAIVGNIGGLDSSIEITALGSPVNFLSRLDELTKTPSVAEFLESGDLIVCEQSNLRLRKMGLEFEGDTIDLRQAKATIRDFPEVDAVHTIKPTDVNYGRLLEAYQQLRVCDGSNREAGEFWIAESI